MRYPLVLIVIAMLFCVNSSSASSRSRIEVEAEARRIVQRLETEMPGNRAGAYEAFVEKTLREIRRAVGPGELSKTQLAFIRDSITEECLYLDGRFSESDPAALSRSLGRFFRHRKGALGRITGQMLERDWKSIRERFRAEVPELESLVFEMLDSTGVVLLDIQANEHFAALRQTYARGTTPGGTLLKEVPDPDELCSRFARAFLRLHLRNTLNRSLARVEHRLDSVYYVAENRYGIRRLSKKEKVRIIRDVADMHERNGTIFFPSYQMMDAWAEQTVDRFFATALGVISVLEEPMEATYKRLQPLISRYPDLIPLRLGNVPDAVAGGTFIAASDKRPAPKEPVRIGTVRPQRYLLFWTSIMQQSVKDSFERPLFLKETCDSYLQQTLDAFSSKVLKLQRFGGERKQSEAQFDEAETLLYEGLREAMKSMDLEELTPQSLGRVFQQYVYDQNEALAGKSDELPAAVRAVKALRSRLDKVLEARRETPAGRREARRWEFREQLDGFGRAVEADFDFVRDVDLSQMQSACVSTTMKVVRKMEPPEAAEADGKSEDGDKLQALSRKFYVLTREDNPLFAPDALSVEFHERQMQFFKYKNNRMSAKARDVYEKIVQLVAQRCGIDLPE